MCRGGFTMKLMKLMFQGPSLARATYKALGGALNKYELSYLFFLFLVLYSFSGRGPPKLYINFRPPKNWICPCVCVCVRVCACVCECRLCFL